MDSKKFTEKMRKKYGEHIISRGRDVNFVSTGFIEIDNLSGGGIPLGRTVQIHGKPGSGKTTLAMHIAKQFDILGYRIAFVDVEGTYPYDLQEALGIKNIDLFEPITGEEAVDTVKDCIDNGYKLVILDSIGSMPVNKELDTSADQKIIGGLSTLASRLVKITTGALRTNDGTLLCLNHIKKVIGSFIGEEYIPGGVLLDHGLSLNIRIQAAAKKEWIMRDDKVVLKPSWVKIVKTKLRSLSEGKTVLYLDKGQIFNEDIDVLTAALNVGIVTKSGAFLKYGDITLGQGILNTLEDLDIGKIERDLLETIRQHTEQRIKLDSILETIRFGSNEKRIIYNTNVDEYNLRWGESLEYKELKDSASKKNSSVSKGVEGGDVSGDEILYKSLEDIIEQTGKSERTLQRWLKDGRIIQKEDGLFYICNTK